MKLADDRGGDVVVRLYEACGGAVRAARLTAGFGLAAAYDCDLLEQPGTRLAASEDGAVVLAFRPFQIRTLRLRPTMRPSQGEVR
ncbi:hypothetical protein GCM10009680_86430 [Streptomyces yatensis]|uniref:Glycosyl hydrolases family 38 C-terminal domain-containing protein n=1 Tax=Streptomyces yatensis TaxID=155177 RepID=A0ABN2JMT1_9ACTN